MVAEQEVQPTIQIPEAPEKQSGDPLLDLKKEVAQTYVNDLKKKAGLGASLVIGEGKKLTDFLVAEGTGDGVSDNAGLALLGNILKGLDTQKFDLDGQQYDIQNYLLRLKEKINNSSTVDQLNMLKTNISTQAPQQTPQNTSDQSLDTTVIATSISYEKLKVGNGITAEEITYVDANAKYILDKLITKGDLTNVAEVKDKNGNIILKCRGESPYINAKAAADLIGLSLMFYKKTGMGLLLESAYRTIEHQKRLIIKNKEDGVPTAEPGYSGHNLGYSLDISKDSRYTDRINGVAGLQKIAEIFNFHPISSEDRHFDHSEFVNTYYKNKAARLPIAQKMEEEYNQYDIQKAA